MEASGVTVERVVGRDCFDRDVRILKRVRHFRIEISD